MISGVGSNFLMQIEQVHRKSNQWRRLAPVTALGLVLAGFVLFSHSPGNSSVSHAQKVATSYEEEIESARELVMRRRFEDALKAIKRANDLKGKSSAECFFLMAQAYFGLENYKNVVQSCDKAIELASDDHEIQAQSYNVKGLALQKQADIKDQKRLQESESAFRQSIGIKDNLPEVHFNLGYVLMQQSRDPEGATELKRFLELAPNHANATDARKLIDNPRRARESFAPDFSLTTSEGENISLENLHGKVVMLDFWGTWCGPCVASVPSLRELNKRYSKDPSFVMIGISSDGDEEKWRTFTAREKMVWRQYLDRERQVIRAFAVRGYPTYIVIDPEGVIRYRGLGMTFEKEAALNDAIQKQLKLLAKPASDK
jgi:peroxiredoxin